jgi:methionyl-tRNA formyltransferase
MRLAFMGTPEFSAPVLKSLLAAGHDVAAVYARAAKPSGRGQKVRPSPVETLALAHGLDVRTPKNFKLAEDRDGFAALNLDVAIVVAYGLILPQAVLDAPLHGCLNLHASLLPRWRGAAPIQRAIMAGDEVTGVQVMQMDAGLDTGAVALSQITPIHDDDTAASLEQRLSQIAAQLAPDALAALAGGTLAAVPQSGEGVVYASKITPDEARIDWTAPAVIVDRHIRGLSPFPGAWSQMRGARVKVLMSRLARAAPSVAAPGEVLSLDDGLTVACGDNAVELVTLQRASKRPQSAAEFQRGFELKVGDRFD